MKKHLLFRADGNSELGLGHMYRLFALIEMIKDNFDFTFVTKKSSIVSIFPTSFSICFIPENVRFVDEPKWMFSNFNPKECIVIYDGYNFDSSFQMEMKKKGYKFVYIDDFVSEYMYADIVINHSPLIEKNHYQKEHYTQLALGTKYSLLRPLFLEKAGEVTKKYKKISSVFVCFGGGDPLNLTQKVLNSLQQVTQIDEIHVLIGAGNKNELNLNSIDKNVLTYSNLGEKDILELMNNCHWAIVPSSTILFELSCIKIPILSGYFVDNQMKIYQGFLENSCIYGIGDFRNYTEDSLTSRFSFFLESVDYNAMIKNQSYMFDDKISLRINQLIQSLC